MYSYCFERAVGTRLVPKLFLYMADKKSNPHPLTITLILTNPTPYNI